jgi:hypothetical protein
VDLSLKAVGALGYPLENIISSVDFAEISDEKTLSVAIAHANGKSGKLILFKVNAEAKSFATGKKNNHYVAIYFSKRDDDGVDLIYIDPTGKKCHVRLKL